MLMANSTAVLLRRVVRHARRNSARQFVDAYDVEEFCANHHDDGEHQSALAILDGGWHWESVLALADVLDQASAATEPQVWSLCEEWWSMVDNRETHTAEVMEVFRHDVSSAAFDAIAGAMEVACPLLFMPQVLGDLVVVPISTFPLPQRHRDALSDAIEAVIGVVQYVHVGALTPFRRWLMEPWDKSMAIHQPSPTSPTGVVIPGPWGQAGAA